MPKLKFKPLPMKLIQESLEIDETSPTYLKWKHRPLHHFENERRWNQANSRGAGKQAGTVSYDSRAKRYQVSVPLAGKSYQASRVIYALAYGTDPGRKDIDHIDGDRSNNHPSNLRAVPHYLNSHNRSTGRDNFSGVRGVSWQKQVEKWIATIKVNKKPIYLGVYADIEDARAARLAAEQKYLGTHSFQASRLA
jgi:hypothetical protein